MDASEIERCPMEVNLKIILNDLLKQLHLPVAEFGIYAATEDELRAYVQIRGLSSRSESVKFIGSPSELVGMSQQSCSRKAIKFLKDLYGFDVVDYNYCSLKILEQNYNTLKQAYYTATGLDIAPELELLSLSDDD